MKRNIVMATMAALAVSGQWVSADVLFTTDINGGATPLAAGAAYNTTQMIKDTSISATNWLSSLGKTFLNIASPATSLAVVSADGTGLTGGSPNFYETSVSYGARSGRFDYNIGNAKSGMQFTLTSAEIVVAGATVDLEWGVGYRLADNTTRVISGGTISSAGTYSVDLTSLDTLLYTDSSNPLNAPNHFRLLLADGASGTSGSVESFTVHAIPEPATLGLVAASGFAVLFIRRTFMI